MSDRLPILVTAEERMAIYAAHAPKDGYPSVRAAVDAWLEVERWVHVGVPRGRISNFDRRSSAVAPPFGIVVRPSLPANWPKEWSHPVASPSGQGDHWSTVRTPMGLATGELPPATVTMHAFGMDTFCGTGELFVPDVVVAHLRALVEYSGKGLDR